MISTESNSFGQTISDVVLNYYNQKVSSKGKPKPGKEWTVLSAFVKEEQNNLSVVSLATGTKCLGENELSLDGGLVHDCHAEVLSKRSLIKYFLHSMKACVNNEETSCFEIDSGKFTLRKSVLFHFYSTLPPCGDATIAPQQDFCQPSKKPKLEPFQDIHRTGAKSIEGLDPYGEGPDFHKVGIMRTKPGRGDPTKSLSCSDKIFKWNIVGIQGSLLSILLKEPIKLSSVTIGGESVNECSLRRAFFERVDNLVSSFKIFRSGGLPPVFDRFLNVDLPACPSSICFNCSGLDVVIVDGRKQGITKKNQNTDSAKSQVSRVKIAVEFLKLVQILELKETIEIPATFKNVLESCCFCYADLKNCSETYNHLKKVFTRLTPDPEERLKRRSRLNNWKLKFKSLKRKTPIELTDFLIISDSDDSISNKLSTIGGHVVDVFSSKKQVNLGLWEEIFNNPKDDSSFNLIFLKTDVVDEFKSFISHIKSSKHLTNEILKNSVLFGADKATVENLKDFFTGVTVRPLSELDRLTAGQVILIQIQDLDVPGDALSIIPEGVLVNSVKLFDYLNVNPSTILQNILLETLQIRGSFFDFVIFGKTIGVQLAHKILKLLSYCADTKYVFFDKILFESFNGMPDCFYFDSYESMLHMLIQPKNMCIPLSE